MIFYNGKMIWEKLTAARVFLYTMFIFFMPFTQALTFNVGFPLKISEIALFALTVIYVLFHREVKVPKPLLLCLASFFLIILTSTAVNIFWQYPYELRTYPSRFGYTLDSVTRLIYFSLSLAAFYISADIYLTDKKKYLSIWISGAITAAVYTWYLMTFSLLKLPVFLLPGMAEHPQNIGPGIIRCGTFLEGNYMGLFLVVSGTISFYLKKYAAGIFLLLSTIPTFAMLSIVSAVILLVVCLKPFLFDKKNRTLVVTVALAGLVAFTFFSRTEFFRIYAYEKIFGSTSSIDKKSNGAFSKVDRLVTAETGIKMIAHNPVFGVGLSNFARHYGQYYTKGNLDTRLYYMLLRKNFKVIANNIYMELAAESGIPALIVFIIFLILLLKYARTDRSNALFTGLICVMICFNAYPSFIMIYLWAFMALPVAHFIQVKQE